MEGLVAIYIGMYGFGKVDWIDSLISQVHYLIKHSVFSLLA